MTFTQWNSERLDFPFLLEYQVAGLSTAGLFWKHMTTARRNI